MSNTDFVLFYSDKCLHSKELINLLYKNQDIYNKFVKINIDITKMKIPPYIKSVPSAIIPINGQPKLLVGVQIFEWYNSINKQMVQKQDISDWDPSSMTGYSDNFSYLSNASEPSEKNYLYLNNENSGRIYTPEDNGNNSKKTDDNPRSSLDYNLEKMKLQRDNEVMSPINRF